MANQTNQYFDIIGKVQNWRRLIGLPVRNNTFLPTNETFIEPSKEEKELALKLILEESEELKEAIQSNNFIEIADALGDLIFVIVQMADIWGMNLYEIVHIVYESNLSKICNSYEEALASQKHYSEKGIKTIIQSIDMFNYKIVRASDGKVLKSCYFKEPNFSKLIKNETES